MNARFARIVALVAACLCALAATDQDPRGWSTGTLAIDTPRVVDGLADPPKVELPKAVAALVTKPTLLVYFSPTCPHCRHVAPELAALAARLGDRAQILGIASSRAAPEELAEFEKTYAIPFRIVQDTDGETAAAMGARSTPSALFLVPEKGKTRVTDVWYPYYPGFDALVLARATGNPYEAFTPGEYQGTNVCGSCHRFEDESYGLTHHAIAWATLVRSEKSADPECQRCHVTGMGQPTGFDGSATSDLVGVGCEACHGPGGPHDGVRADAREACATCHDDKHSIAFSVEKGLPLIDHYSATNLSAEDYQARRQALFGGEVPRALLAFPAGPTAGAAACVSCHGAEHSQWADSRHARAMKLLTGEDAKNAECVRCHATPTAIGPGAPEVAAFRTLEGVGCESCHGPGVEHAKSGGTAPIEGLGEDCPVCVIEAVCTSCHTPKWDPDWALDPALAAIRHLPPKPE